MSRFEYQKKRKQESEQKIIQAFVEEKKKGKSFTELLHYTKLSKPVLTQRLKSMMREGMIDKTLSEDKKKILYVPTHELLKSRYSKSLSFYRSSIDGIFKEVEEVFKNKTFSDKECFELLSKKISFLTLYTFSLTVSGKLDRKWMISYLSNMIDKLEKLPKERLERIKEALNELYPDETSLLKRLYVKYLVDKILPP